jgi:FAD/FMN-containing dehydrogenase
VRGGGGNFGIVTSFEYRAHPVGPDVFLTFVVHAGRDSHEALRFYRKWAITAPDEVSSFALLWHAPEIEGFRPSTTTPRSWSTWRCTVESRRVRNTT